MKRGIALLLSAVLLFSCSACGSGGFKLVDVPKELALDVQALSEDADNLMAITDRTPLIAAAPEEDVYIYCTDAKIKAGVLVKYDGRIQYFPWIFTPEVADPQVYVADYNGDGVRDVAFTYCETASDLRHNENLHILLGGEKKLTDQMCAWETAAVYAAEDVNVSQKDDGSFIASLYGKTQSFSLDTEGFGDYLGLFAEDFQDFTLGETITLRVKSGLVFSDRSLPVYDVLEFTAVMACGEGALRLEDAAVTVLS